MVLTSDDIKTAWEYWCSNTPMPFWGRISKIRLVIYAKPSSGASAPRWMFKFSHGEVDIQKDDIGVVHTSCVSEPHRDTSRVVA